MKMPASVLETSFKEFTATTGVATTSMSIVSRLKSLPTPQPSTTSINIKPEHILIGIVVLLLILWVLNEIKKSGEEKEKRILLTNSQRRI